MNYSVSQSTGNAADLCKSVIRLKEDIIKVLTELYGETSADILFEKQFGCYDVLNERCKELLFDSINDKLLEKGGEL